MQTAIGLLLLLACTIHTSAATVVTFYGQDDIPPATAVAPGPNTTAALASFLAAAGTVRVIDFEADPPGSFGPGATRNLTGGVVIEATEDATGTIATDDQFNVTPGGRNYLGVVMSDRSNFDEIGSITFHFPHPVFSFGAFFARLNDVVQENPQQFDFLFTTGGTPHIVNVTNAFPPRDFVALVFFGFVAPGSAIDSLTLQAKGSLVLDNAFSMDDIHYSPIPEPGTSLLLGVAVLILVRARRSR
jgi:hypothetical protein